MTTTQKSTGLVVVETTSGAAYLGEIQEVDGIITVYSGLRGRPATIPVEAVLEMTPAEHHPDVVFD